MKENDVIEVKLVQSSKAENSILATLDGMVIDVKLLQLLRAP